MARRQIVIPLIIVIPEVPKALSGTHVAAQRLIPG
jgi:hypothetical protein